MTTVTAKSGVQSVINKAHKTAQIVNDYAETLKEKLATFRTIPGFSGYEINSAGKIRSKATGKIQQIPAGKKKYFIFNDKKERKSIGTEEIIALMPKAAAKPAKVAKVKKDKVVREPKTSVIVNIKELQAKSDVKKILETGGKKHVLCYKLHKAGYANEEIMALVGTPYGATMRNIWYYTSGKKTLL